LDARRYHKMLVCDEESLKKLLPGVEVIYQYQQERADIFLPKVRANTEGNKKEGRKLKTMGFLWWI
ncbi:hypothetical protein, partial [Helicobacter suis]|uniref:hypothetical protein n=1 Tax=Helicobacter suis TaxID=104628 RepID=UPI0013D6BCAF